ncbi:MAG: hypothetical protein U1A77_26420 [Pirellulales bacterium]
MRWRFCRNTVEQSRIIISGIECKADNNRIHPSPRSNRFSSFQFKGLSPLQGGQFLAVLRGKEYVVDMVGEFKLVTPEDAEDWTMSVPQDMVDKLATLQADQIPNIAAQFANATSEELGWSADEFLPVVTQLSALARRAVDTNKSMYLWNCL